jgi:hypothetical protein
MLPELSGARSVAPQAQTFGAMSFLEFDSFLFVPEKLQSGLAQKSHDQVRKSQRQEITTLESHDQARKSRPSQEVSCAFSAVSQLMLFSLW